MTNMTFRKATEDDFTTIFMMGFDVWGNGSATKYLEECRSSSKYKSGQWFVLKAEDGTLVSSLIVYTFGANEFGFGSIATPKELRKQGYASNLISRVLQQIKCNSPNAAVFLYSDIDPAFYERFDFRQVPRSAQRYETTTCMVQKNSIETFTAPPQTPEYF